MDDDEEKEILTAIKIPKLPKDATPVEWGFTKLKLQNACARRGCLPAFSSAALPNLPADENAANDDDERKAVKMNRACMAILMESFQDNETAFAIAIDTIDKTAWPMGRAHKTMEEMKAEYERQGFQSEIERDKLLEEIKMGVRDNPSKLFNALQRVKFLYLNTTNEIKDKEMIKLVIRKLPSSIYASQIEIIKNKYAVKEQKTNADDMPYTFFRRGILDYFNELNNTEGSNNEVTLLNLFDTRGNNRGGDGGRDRRNGGGNGGGNNNNSGDSDGDENENNDNNNNSSDDNEKDNQNQTRTKRCTYCGRKGHLAFECWER